jgi:hypothetical protein
MAPIKNLMEANEIKRQEKFTSDKTLAANFASKQMLSTALR